MGLRLSLDDINQRIKCFGFTIECFKNNQYRGCDTLCTFRCRNNHLFERRLHNVIYHKWNVYCPLCKPNTIEENKKIRFEKIQEKFKKKGLELLSGIYDNDSEICDVKCRCGAVFNIQIRSVLTKKFVCCINCNKKNIHYNDAVRKFEELNCLLDIDKDSFRDGTKKCKMFCKICRTEYIKSYCHVIKCLTINKNKTLYLKCGCYKKNLLGQKFGELTVISNNRKWTKKGFLEECECSCGVRKFALRSELMNGIRSICDKNHLTRILSKNIKEYLSKQNIEMLTEYKGARKYVKLKCNCGKTFKLIGNTLSQKFKKNEDVSCHNMVNGCMTSKKAVQLHRLITDFGIHNFKSKKCGFIDIAFVYQGRKIAIEYDEWFWHRKNLARDKRKTKKLIDNNWLVVRFLASDDLPNIKDIWDAIDKLIKTNKKYILIKSKDWKDYD